MSGANQSSAELVFNCRLVNIKREKNRRFHLKILGVLESTLRCVISSFALCWTTYRELLYSWDSHCLRSLNSLLCCQNCKQCRCWGGVILEGTIECFNALLCAKCCCFLIKVQSKMKILPLISYTHPHAIPKAYIICPVEHKRRQMTLLHKMQFKLIVVHKNIK